MLIGDIWKVALAVIASLGGGGLIVLSLSNWLGKVWANRLLEQERARHAEDLERLKSRLEEQARLMQGEIEKMIFVSRAQFETEFAALKEIWRNLVRVRSRMSLLRPEIIIVPAGQTRDDQHEELRRDFKEFQAAYISLAESIDDHSPFYPSELFEELNRVRIIARREANDLLLRHDDAFQAEWFDRGQKNFEEYSSVVNRIADLIRDRISKLSIGGIPVHD